MIQPNELRIGNYLNSRKGYTKVVGVICDMIETETHSDILDNFDPIPITPEILDRVDGFELITWNKVVKDYFIPITSGGLCSLSFRFGDWKDFPDRLDSVTIRPSPEGGGGSVYGKFGVKYLHQLQNLYHSLTGIELTFKTN